MPHIKFSHYWNKLTVAPGGLFTTIRRHTPEKAEYYKNLEGKVLDVLLNDKPLFRAKLLQVFVGDAKDLSGYFLSYDTDSSYEWMQKIDNYGKVLVLLFQRVKE